MEDLLAIEGEDGNEVKDGEGNIHHNHEGDNAGD